LTLALQCVGLLGFEVGLQTILDPLSYDVMISKETLPGFEPELSWLKHDVLTFRLLALQGIGLLSPGKDL